jgi:hypothetical protein
MKNIRNKPPIISKIVHNGGDAVILVSIDNSMSEITKVLTGGIRLKKAVAMTVAKTGSFQILLNHLII